MRQYAANLSLDELKVVYAKIMDTSKGHVVYTNVYSYQAGTTWFMASFNVANVW